MSDTTIPTAAQHAPANALSTAARHGRSYYAHDLMPLTPSDRPKTMSHVAQPAEAPTVSPEDNVSTQPAQPQSSNATVGQVADASTTNVTDSGQSVAGDLPDQQTEDGQGEPAELEVDDVRISRAWQSARLNDTQS